jgi:selenophosphate synthetase-related protein
VDASAADEAVRAFTDRGLAAARCGAFDDTGVLRLRSGEETAVVWDTRAAGLTGLGGNPR